MKPQLMSRYESIVFSRDGGWMLELLSMESVAGLRIWQEGAVVLEYHGGHWSGGTAVADLARQLTNNGVEVDAVFDLEVFYLGNEMAGLAGIGNDGPRFYMGNPKEGVTLRNWCEGREGIGGTTLFLCLNGPGFNKEARALLENRPGIVTFAVNNGAHGFRPDFWTCMDAPHRFMRSVWEDGRITKFLPRELGEKSIVKDMPDGPVPWDCPRVIGYDRNDRNDRFCAADFLGERSFNWGNHKDHGGGRSVMLAALKIAWVLGFRRVVLVGCDFEMSAEKKYWFPQERTRHAIKNNMTTYERLRGMFAELAPLFDAAGFVVVNATPGSKLAAFPMVDLNEEVDRALLNVRGTTAGMYE